MKRPLGIVAACGFLLIGQQALSQSPAPPPPSPDPAPAASPASPPPAAPASKTPTAAGAGGKRATCLNQTQGLKGQDKLDQMQLCMAQARVDCLKQAIDQKVVGPQRRDFVKDCASEP